jgi:hypothetical protein
MFVAPPKSIFCALLAVVSPFAAGLQSTAQTKLAACPALARINP